MPWRISSSLYSDAIPTARRELDAIGAIDVELMGLGPEQLQAPIETRRKAVGPDALPEDGSLPVKKADVIEYDTELLREKTITRFGVGLSIEAALRRQRGGHAQALVLMLPTPWRTGVGIRGSAVRAVRSQQRWRGAEP